MMRQVCSMLISREIGIEYGVVDGRFIKESLLEPTRIIQSVEDPALKMDPIT